VTTGSGARTWSAEIEENPVEIKEEQ